MYEYKKPKEITYILTLNGFLTKKHIGYVKIKLIDWDVKSCYISIAIDDSQEVRGKGYAKATYEAFFPFLYSLGILKIYGRTYENNIATIKLNISTGFRLVGRQTAFMVYPNQTSHDALLFGKLSPEISTTVPPVDTAAHQHYFKLLCKAYLGASITEQLQSRVLFSLPPLNEYTNYLSSHQIMDESAGFALLQKSDLTPKVAHIEKILTSLTSLFPNWQIAIASNTQTQHIDFQNRRLFIDASLTSKTYTAITLIIIRHENARRCGYEILSVPVTVDTWQEISSLAESILTGSHEVCENDLLCNAPLQLFTHALQPLFLAKDLLYRANAILAIATNTAKAIGYVQ
jgi:hypothetical protein